MRVRLEVASAFSPRAALVALLAAASACATTHGTATPATVPAPVTYEMEPLKITAVKGPDGQHLESFDATELFEQAGAELSEKRFDDAIKTYDRLLKEFDDPRYKKAALYNTGLALQGKKDWAAAIERFRILIDQYPDTDDAKDALYQTGASYAEMENWPTSAVIFAEILQRKDLNADDRIEALGRRGFAQFKLKDLDTAERTFRSALAYFTQIEKDQRLQTDFYLGLCKYHLGQIPHERFRAAPLRLPERQMNIDLDEKARLLLTAQRQYIETIKLGNPQWASAAGYQVGSLYEELYDAFIHAPIPPEMLGAANVEKRDVYFDELRKKIRILLEKSAKWTEQNLLMIERLGIDNEWRDKSKLAFAKLQKLLDPNTLLHPGEEGPEAPPATTPGPGPATPVPPTSRPPATGPGEAAPPTIREPNQPPRAPAFQRQIL
ncbi:MAG TPA: tetratricopeptide repeat protein [Polyangia bacterium]|jgi:TolA-binding protein|nr:tetratricopeptide repeat protein [Polyangia bacterium]